MILGVILCRARKWFFRSFSAQDILGFCDFFCDSATFFYDSASDDSTAGLLHIGNTVLVTEVD